MCACLLRRNPVLQCPPPDKGAGKGAGTSAMRPRGLSIRSLNAAERDVGSTLCSNASSKRKSDELGAVEEEEKATKRITRDTLAEHGLATQIARQAASASAQAADQLPPLDRTDLSKNTVQALKQYMSAAGLDTVGNKKQLVDRLAAHFSAADAAPIEADPTPAAAKALEPQPSKLSDDELLARYPEEASMIDCGVPREEILAGLRSRTSLKKAAPAGSAASDLTMFQDASFLQSVLGSLPGVDPQADINAMPSNPETKEGEKKGGDGK